MMEEICAMSCAKRHTQLAHHLPESKVNYFKAKYLKIVIAKRRPAY
jgi:hypothetical protein